MAAGSSVGAFMSSSRCCAARSLSPRIGSIRNRILHSSGLRPYPSIRVCMSARNAFIRTMLVPWASIVSACLAAKSRPSADAPAWTMTGRRCGPGTVFSSPGS